MHQGYPCSWEGSIHEGSGFWNAVSGAREDHPQRSGFSERSHQFWRDSEDFRFWVKSIACGQGCSRRWKHSGNHQSLQSVDLFRFRSAGWLQNLCTRYPCSTTRRTCGRMESSSLRSSVMERSLGQIRLSNGLPLRSENTWCPLCPPCLPSSGSLSPKDAGSNQMNVGLSSR